MTTLFTNQITMQDAIYPIQKRGMSESPQSVRTKMSSLLKKMLTGDYSTEELLPIFNEYSPQNLTTQQILGCLDGVLETATYIINAKRYQKPVIVPAGTGGDGKGTVNITTLAGFVMAASEECIVPLYGNRKASGKFGKMDLLEALSIKIDLSSREVHTLLNTVSISPVFARTIYPGAKYVAQARLTFGGPTLFNVVMPQAAPVTNDAILLVGSSKADQLETMGVIAAARGVKRAMFVHNLEYNLDEIAMGCNKLVIVNNGKVQVMELSLGEKEAITLLKADRPEDFVRLFKQALDPAYNSSQLDSIRKVVAMNAACGLFLVKGTGNFSSEFSDYFNLALNLIYSGKAKQKLEQLQNLFK